MKTSFIYSILWVSGILLLSSCNKTVPEPIVCSILVDLTVEDRDAIRGDVKSLFDKISYKFNVRDQAKELLNAELNLMYINDKGSSGTKTIFKLGHLMGEDSINLTNAKKQLDLWKETILKEIDSTGKIQFKRSNYIQTIMAAADNSSEIMILGDLAIEDGELKFESKKKLNCGNFHLLNKLNNKFIDYKRTNIPNQSPSRIIDIESCWNKNLYNSENKILRKSRCF